MSGVVLQNLIFNLPERRFDRLDLRQDVEEAGVGSGLSTAELGLRLRYEIRRQFAPYIGVNWERAIGEAADFARADGEDAGAVSAVVGVRLWF
jgi:copper resistance protein B